MIWIAGVCALPWLDGGRLALVTALLLPALIAAPARARARLLLRRTRILLGALFLVYALGTPGLPLVPSWPALGPTVEGLTLGALQAWRLLLLLISLAWLLSRLGRPGLLAAIYTLLRPFAVLGLPVERFAVRLTLVLALAETAPRAKLSAVGLAAALEAPPTGLPSHVTVEVPVASWRDGLCLLLFAAGLGALLW